MYTYLLDGALVVCIRNYLTLDKRILDARGREMRKAMSAIGFAHVAWVGSVVIRSCVCIEIRQGRGIKAVLRIARREDGDPKIDRFLALGRKSCVASHIWRGHSQEDALKYSLIFLLVMALSVPDSAGETQNRVFEPSNPSGTKTYYREPVETKTTEASTIAIEDEQPTEIKAAVEAVPSDMRTETAIPVEQYGDTEPTKHAQVDEQSESYQPIMWRKIKEPSKQSTSTLPKSELKPAATTVETTFDEPAEATTQVRQTVPPESFKQVEPQEREPEIERTVREQTIDRTEPKKLTERAAPLDSDPHDVSWYDGLRNFGSRSVDGVSGAFHSPANGGFYETYIRDRVVLGTRIITFSLSDDDVSLGTINKLNDIQDHAPTKIFLNYLMNPYWGFELSYDKIEAETRTSDGKSDGDVEMSGPILSVFGRYPNHTGFVPYGGIGLAVFGGDFDEEAHWALGYPNPEAYVDAGSPSTPLGGRTRSMSVDDYTGTVIYLGVVWEFWERWAADVLFRYMDMEADSTFTGKVHGNVETVISDTFDLSNTAYGLGIRYTF